MNFDTIVVGGGQAALAASYHLQKAGRDHVLSNAGDAPTGSWPRYYESLRLFSPARYSSLPGLQFPGDPDHYPVRDEVTAYLKRYAVRFDVPILHNSRVTKVTKVGDEFAVIDASGIERRARNVICATGSFSDPYTPNISGQDDFLGEFIHAIDYRGPEAFEGKRVVVVGAANTAVQVAVELAKVADVTLAIRDKIRFAPQRALGKDLHFWLALTGIDNLRLLKDQSSPVLDDGTYRAALNKGLPRTRPMFESFTETGVRWRSGQEETVDVVLFATGYRVSLPFLEEGAARLERAQNGVSADIPGLFFVGYSGQRAFNSATLRGVGKDASVVVRELDRTRTSRSATGRN